MDNFKSMEEFINSPDSVDFVLQKSEALYKYIAENPYIHLARELNGGFVVAYVDRNNIEIATENLGSVFKDSESKVMGLLEQESLDASGITQVQQDPNLRLSGKGVLFGIVDTGIDYTKDVFRYPDGTTRIVSIYDQTIGNTFSKDIIYGTEFTSEQINQALKSDDPYSVVPSEDTNGHGTFLSSVAAGSSLENFTGAAYDAELVVVKLRKAKPYYLDKYCVPAEQENAFSSSSVIIGIDYILEKAKELGRPVVICIGLGTNYGGHSGFSVLEQYITFVAQQIGVCICIATGNESQAGHHFYGRLDQTKDVLPVEVTVGPGVSCIYITMWNKVSDRLSVAIQSPNGEIVQRVTPKPGTKYFTKFSFGNSSSIVEYSFPSRILDSQNTEIKLFNPFSGIWTIFVYGDVVQEGDFHIYLPMTGFVDPSVKFVIPNPYFTTTIPATSFGAIDCGAYDTRTDELFYDSSWGPTTSNLNTPDFAAPGVNVAGIYPDGPGVMSGTSVAAAITSGACALILQWGVVEQKDLSLSTYRIRAFLIQGAVQMPGVSYPNYQWGYGKLNLENSYDIIKTVD